MVIRGRPPEKTKRRGARVVVRKKRENSKPETEKPKQKSITEDRKLSRSPNPILQNGLQQLRRRRSQPADLR